MKTIIFNGREFAKQKETELTKRIQVLKKQNITPKLVWITVGNDPASLLYGKLKSQTAKRLGIEFKSVKFPPKTSPDQIIQQIQNFNKDESIHGIMVQLPVKLSKTNNKSSIIDLLSSIDPVKDVDCLTPQNLGLILAKQPRFLPATVRAVIQTLSIAFQNSFHNQLNSNNLSGQRIVVVGGGLEAGRPLINQLSNLGATILWARSSEKNLKQITLQADIIISAVGKSNLITGDMIRNGVIAIDVGAPQGDFDFSSIKKKTIFITPVPGGVGPVTIISLMENVVKATETQKLFFQIGNENSMFSTDSS